MDNVYNWILNNKEWLFGGLGLAILLGIWSFIKKFFFNKIFNKKSVTPTENNNSQKDQVIGIHVSGKGSQVIDCGSLNCGVGLKADGEDILIKNFKSYNEKQ